MNRVLSLGLRIDGWRQFSSDQGPQTILGLSYGAYNKVRREVNSPTRLYDTINIMIQDIEESRNYAATAAEG